MILLDVNVLVYAYRREALAHDRYAAWLTDLVGGSDDLALVEQVLTGFVRIVTNPRIFGDPAPTKDALSFVEVLRTAGRARWLVATDAAWKRFARLTAADGHIRGNLVPDAWLAALALAHGCRLATGDRGFARFPELDWFTPIR